MKNFNKTSLLLTAMCLLLGFTIAFAQAPAIEWQKSYGGTDYEKSRSIVQTEDGGYIVAGESQSSDGDLTVNKGATDIWIVKVDSIGNIEWQKSLGGSDSDAVSCIRQNSDLGYIVAGWTRSGDGDVSGNHVTGRADYWVVKLSASGVIQWQKCYGGSLDDRATAIDQTTDNGYIVAGKSNSNDGDVYGNHGGYDYWILRLDSVGNFIWRHSLGGPADDMATSIQQTTDGQFIVGGTTFSPWTPLGDVQYNHGGADYWVFKLDAGGYIHWRISLGGYSNDYASSFIQTNTDEYIVAGYSNSNSGNVSGNNGGNDFWIAKLDGYGQIEWAYSYGGSLDDKAASISQASDGGYVVSGSTYSNDGDVGGNHNPVSHLDSWVIKLSSSGILEWQKCLGGTQDDYAYTIVSTNKGECVISGGSSSSDGDVTGHHGGLPDDYWVVKLEADFPLNALPMSGVYTIGGVNPDFVNFDSAVSALEYNGISGNVIFKVRPGNYTEQITIPFIAGVSAAKTIKFSAENGIVSSVILKYGASSALDNWVVKLNEAMYISFDGLTLESTGSTFANVLYINDHSRYIKIINCMINAPVTSTETINKSLIFASGSYGTNDMEFRNNILNNGSYGIYVKNEYYATLHQQILNNTFLNQYKCGIFLMRANYIDIKGNLITTNSANNGYNGIIGLTTYIVSIEKNKVICENGNGVYLDFFDDSRIINNFIQVQGSGLSYGIWGIIGNGTSLIYNNTINITNTNPFSTALYLPAPIWASWIIYNNILINNGGGYAINIEQNHSISGMDYNDFFTTGSKIGMWETTDCATLANWKSTSGWDVHSESINPVFVSTTDLHIQSTPSPLNFGMPLPSDVPDDIDGTLRSSTPDVGADEFDNCNVPTMPSSITTQGGIPKVCPGDIRTYTTAQAAGVTYNWTVPTGAVINSGQGTRSINVTYNNNFTASGVISVVKVNGCGSSAPRNLSVYKNIPAIPSNITGPNFGMCGGHNIVYSVQQVQGMTYNWTVPGLAHIVSGQGTNSITVNFQTVNFAKTISVTASNYCGSSATRSLIIRSAPQKPGAISGNANVCSNSTGNVYTIAPVALATDYTWTGPNGSQITANGVTSIDNTITTTAITVTIDFGIVKSTSTVRVKANNTCGSSAQGSLILTPCSPRLEDVATDLDATVYPNPTNGLLTLVLNSAYSTHYTLLVNDVLGKQVMKESLDINAGLTEHQMNLQQLKPGLYFLTLMSTEVKQIIKITKE